MRDLILSLILGMCGISANAADMLSSFQYDFEECIPEGIVMLDGDANTPSPDLYDYGFEIGVPWVRHYVENEDNYVMASTSWYEPAGKANDWMILPPVMVTEADMQLGWRAKSNHKTLRDGYSVYISESGNTITDFDLSGPVFRVSGEENRWTAHNIPLSDYVGKNIWVAFVNDSEDCSVLWIDDICAGKPGNASVKLSMPMLQKAGETLKIKGVVTLGMDVPLGGITIGWSLNDQTGSKAIKADDVEDGRLPFDVDTGITLVSGEDSTLEVWAECGGVVNRTSQTIYPRHKRVLLEEGTGTWCSYCIRGIVFSEIMKSMYPETSVVVAYHSDVMGVDYFLDKVGSFIQMLSLPSGCCNRNKKYSCDPGDFPQNYLELQQEDIEASLDMRVKCVEDGIFEVTSESLFAHNSRDCGYKLTYQIIENDVNVPDNPDYAQNNGYAGGTHGEMGGYENMPAVIPPAEMFYQDVARGEICDFYGIEESLPDDVEKGKVYNHSFCFSLPEDVLVDANCELVGVLLNAEGIAINCAKISLRDVVSSVKPVDLSVDIPREVARYSADGTRLSFPVKGINIIVYSDGSVKKQLN